MTQAEKIALIRTLFDDLTLTDDQISTYILLASGRILQRLYPFGNAPSELPAEYDNTTCELAVRMIARRNGEGETSHSENGISRKWATANDEDILQRLVPHVGVALP